MNGRKFPWIRWLLAPACALILALPAALSAQGCPEVCEQKFEAGQTQHRLGHGTTAAVTGPEYHTTWYVNACSTDHACADPPCCEEDAFVAAASNAVANADVEHLVHLTTSSRWIEFNASRGALQFVTCRGVAAQVSMPAPLGLAVALAVEVQANRRVRPVWTNSMPES
jgi:hypothetical protein